MSNLAGKCPASLWGRLRNLRSAAYHELSTGYQAGVAHTLVVRAQTLAHNGECSKARRFAIQAARALRDARRDARNRRR